VARMVLGLPRPGVAKFIGPKASRSGWGGYVKLGDSEPLPRAAVVLNDGTAVLLHGAPKLINKVPSEH
ncbi:MAG: hypothetical protein LJE95_15670, partial [Acidobacteria bacterium]|nr:hypothetical protein [Acidobacteriota bacterium]